MTASIALVVGILAGIAVLAVAGRPSHTAPMTRRPLETWTAVLGLAASLAFAVAALGGGRLAGGYAISIALVAAGVVVGMTAFRTGARGWRLWLGGLGLAIPAVAWLAFLIGDLAGLGG